MKSFILLALLTGLRLGATIPAHSQSKKFSIKGVVKDSATQEGLSLATVYVKNLKDSVLENYVLTDKTGAFEMTGLPRDQPLSFKIFYIGYKRYHKIFQNSTKDQLDLGTVPLVQADQQLSEVKIVGEKPPIVIRNDTIEFNASSFHTRPNSPLSGLLKKLPGVTVDKDGNIKAQGKPVDQIKVNGNDFFGKDPKIALQNLPAAIIDKVQIFDTKTDLEELTGEQASGDSKTINVTLEKGKDQGFFGRAYAGYGTDKHYDLSAMLNYFQGDRQISILGATNNINEIGFSTGEISNMLQGHGGGSVATYNNGASMNVGGFRLGGGHEGFRRSTTAGVNYNDQFGKHLKFNGSYIYGHIKSDNQTQVSQQNILPDSLFHYQSKNTSHQDQLSHRAHFNLKYTDSSWIIRYKPTLAISTEKSLRTGKASSSNEKGNLINQSQNRYTREVNGYSLTNNLTIARKLKKKGQLLIFRIFGNSYHNKGNNFNRFKNNYYTGTITNDSANQNIKENILGNSYFFTLSYAHPLSKNIKLNLRYEADWALSKNHKTTFNYNSAKNRYNLLDSTLSNNFCSQSLIQIPTAGLSLDLDSSRWQIEANAAFHFIQLDDYSFTHQLGYKKKETFVNPDIQIYRSIGSNGSFRLSYNTYVRQPFIHQLLPVADNSNPLYITKGNPDLKPSIKKRMRLSYNGYNLKSGNNLGASVYYFQTKNDITSVTSYDAQHRQTTTYTNVNGNKGFSARLHFSKSKKKKDFYWRAGSSLSGQYQYHHAFVNTQDYISQSYSFYFRPSFTIGINDIFEVNPYYSLSYHYNKYDINALHNRENIQQNLNFSWEFYLPKRFTWTSDIRYTRNSNITPGFQKGYWLWNATIGYDFFKERQATIQFSVFDLLDQNTSVYRNITDTFIQDTQTQILQRYFMIKLIYRLKKFEE